VGGEPEDGDIDVAANARAEVAGLHEFFVDWFNDAVEGTDKAFIRVASVLHPDFSMVTPSGEVLDREQVLGLLRDAHASADRAAPVRIEIRSLLDRVVDHDTALVTYEEWQFAGDRLMNRRTSTAFFVRAAAAPHGVVWRHLHETMLGSA
jgi:hypothetical protein